MINEKINIEEKIVELITPIVPIMRNGALHGAGIVLGDAIYNFSRNVEVILSHSCNFFTI